MNAGTIKGNCKMKFEIDDEERNFRKETRELKNKKMHKNSRSKKERDKKSRFEQTLRYATF